MGLNTHMYPTNIREFRQAIVHAINYTDLYAKAYLGQMTPYVGPEYPAWKDFYNLGNTPSYDYNVALAKKYLAEAEAKYPNLTTSMPTLTLRSQSGCPTCTNAAQVVQSNLADIGINVNIVVQSTGNFYSVLGSYSSQLANIDALGQLAFVNSGFGWGPATLSPADYWVTFVSNKSTWGNYAEYYDPVVQKCVDSFTSNPDPIVSNPYARMHKRRFTMTRHTLGLAHSDCGSRLEDLSSGRTGLLPGSIRILFGPACVQLLS